MDKSYQIQESSKVFREMASEALASFSWSPTQVLFAPYISALSQVKSILFSKNTAIKVVAAISKKDLDDPNKKDLRDNPDFYRYLLFFDEYLTIEIVLSSLLKKQRLKEEDIKEFVEKNRNQEIDFPKLLSFLIEKKVFDDEKDLFVHIYGLLRGLLMHEALHILLAHMVRRLSVAEKLGYPLQVTNKASEEEKALYFAFHELSNVIEDVFINEAIHESYEKNKDFIEERINRVLSWQSNLSVKDFFHLYKIDSFVEYEGSLKKKNLIELIDSYFEHDLSDDEREHLQTLKRKVKKDLLNLLVEEDLIEPLAAILKRIVKKKLQQQKQQQTKNSRGQNKQDQSQSNSSNQSNSSSSQKQKSKDCQKKSCSCCNGNGAETNDDTCKDTQTQEKKEESSSQTQKKSESGSSSGSSSTSKGQIDQSQITADSIADSAIKKARSSQVKRIVTSGGDVIDIIMDENGNIIDIQTPEKLDPKTKKAIEEFAKKISKRAEALTRAKENELSEDERPKFRGFSSIVGRSLSKISEREFHWTAILKEALKTIEGTSEKKSWLIPIRSFKRRGVHLPNTISDNRRKDRYYVIFMIDSSGSMSDREVEQALSSLLNATKTKIQKVLIAFHDYNLYRFDRKQRQKVLSTLISKNIKFDRNLLLKEGLLLFENDQNLKASKLKKLLVEVAKNLPEGGTSHLRPLEELFEIKSLKKSALKISAIVAFSDCYSDLESISSKTLSRLTQNNKTKFIIINSDKSRLFRHREFTVVDVKGHIVSKPKLQKAKTL